MPSGQEERFSSNSVTHSSASEQSQQMTEQVLRYIPSQETDLLWGQHCEGATKRCGVRASRRGRQGRGVGELPPHSQV